jgi:hypothetical protein
VFVEGRRLARWRGLAVGHEATVTGRFPGGSFFFMPLVSARPFPAPARQSVHAVLPHTAYRRCSPPAFGRSRQSLKGLGATTVPDREISPQ